MNTPVYNCVIVDDDEIDRLTTRSWIKKYPFLNVTGMFSSAPEAMDNMQNDQTDILFTDIDMPEVNGLDFRRNMKHIPACIFITSYPDYAIESFDTEAFDFLVKPLTNDRFDRCMQRLLSYFELRNKASHFDRCLGGDTIFIKDGHDQVKINLHDIIYLEGLKDYTRIITTGKKHCVLSSIGNLLLDSTFQSFVRIHRSYAVQRHYIQRFTPQQVYIKDYTLPIGRTYKDVLANLK